MINDVFKAQRYIPPCNGSSCPPCPVQLGLRRSSLVLRPGPIPSLATYKCTIMYDSTLQTQPHSQVPFPVYMYIASQDQWHLQARGCMWVHLHPIHTPVHPLTLQVQVVCSPKPIKVVTHCMHFYYTVTAGNKYATGTYTWTVYMEQYPLISVLSTVGNIDFCQLYASTCTVTFDHLHPCS